MKKLINIFFLTFFFFSSCSEDNDIELGKISITLKFTHNWDGVPVTSSDFNNFKFVTRKGQSISIEKLRYVLSNIAIGNQTLKYNLVDLGENSGLEITINEVESRNQQLKFTFGFTNNDNIDGVYHDLNSANFNVPGMLGGGYHYMQFDGKYKDTNNQDANFNYHAIRAVNNSNPNNLIFEDTSFEVDLKTLQISSKATVEIKMNIAEWFKNPNIWDLNELNTVLMPNFEAQKMMSANGKTVFSLGDVSQ